MLRTFVMLPSVFTFEIGGVESTAQISEATMKTDAQTATVKTLKGETDIGTGNKSSLTLAAYSDWQRPPAESLCWALWDNDGELAEFTISSTTEDGMTVTCAGKVQCRKPPFGPTADDASKFSIDLPCIGAPSIVQGFGPLPLPWASFHWAGGQKMTALGYKALDRVLIWPDEEDLGRHLAAVDPSPPVGVWVMTNPPGVALDSGQMGADYRPSGGIYGPPYTLVWCGRLAQTGSQRLVSAKQPGGSATPCLQITGGSFRAATGNGTADSTVLPAIDKSMLILAEFADTARIEVNGVRTVGTPVSGGPTMTGLTLGSSPASQATNPSDALTWLCGSLPVLLEDSERAELLSWAGANFGVVPG